MKDLMAFFNKTSILNFFDENYYDQKAVARDYDNALKKEAMAKEKARKHKIDFDKANEEFLKAREERKEIQERMRKASLACAQGLRDPGLI